MKNITILITQIIAMIFGALTVAGITVDPAVQADIQSQAGNVINAVAGLAIMVTALVGSIKSVWDKITGNGG
jgi:hypothetical protein